MSLSKRRAGGSQRKKHSTGLMCQQNPCPTAAIRSNGGSRTSASLGPELLPRCSLSLGLMTWRPLINNHHSLCRDFCSSHWPDAPGWALSELSGGFTYHGGVSESLDSLEDATPYCSHRESASTVIHYPPGTAEKTERRILRSVTGRTGGLYYRATPWPRASRPQSREHQTHKAAQAPRARQRDGFPHGFPAAWETPAESQLCTADGA